MGKMLSSLCFPVNPSEPTKSTTVIEEEEGGADERYEEPCENDDSFYLITPCEGILHQPMLIHKDISKLFTFGKLIWKSRTKKVVEGKEARL